MQFLPGTWARYAADGDGDGVDDPQNLYDASLAAARYLCGGGLNLREPSQMTAAILRYNNSASYARNVMGWDAHLDNPEGLGPGLPLNIDGLPATERKSGCKALA